MRANQTYLRFDFKRIHWHLGEHSSENWHPANSVSRLALRDVLPREELMPCGAGCTAIMSSCPSRVMIPPQMLGHPKLISAGASGLRLSPRLLGLPIGSRPKLMRWRARYGRAKRGLITISGACQSTRA